MQIIFLPLHLLILLATAVGIFKADKLGMAWMRGKKEMLDAAVLERYHWWVVAGLAGMILTGIGLVLPNPNDYIHNPAFVMKMVLVGMLVVNSAVIGSLMKIATVRSYASLSTREKLPLFISGAVSAVGWIGAVIAATML